MFYDFFCAISLECIFLNNVFISEGNVKCFGNLKSVVTAITMISICSYLSDVICIGMDVRLSDVIIYGNDFCKHGV